MAALSAISRAYGVDQSITYAFTSVADGDTFNIGKGKTSVIYQMTGNPSTQTSAGSAVDYVSSTGVCTMYPGVDSLGATLRVYPR